MGVGGGRVEGGRGARRRRLDSAGRAAVALFCRLRFRTAKALGPAGSSGFGTEWVYGYGGEPEEENGALMVHPVVYIAYTFFP